MDSVKVDVETKMVTITTNEADSLLLKKDVERALSKYPQYTVASFAQLPKEK